MPTDAITLRIEDLFRIGPGPSSSHTVGPMVAARRFRLSCIERGIVPAGVSVLLQGSLSATGHGHGTDKAVLAGLCGMEPETVDPDVLLAIETRLAEDSQVAWGDGSVELRPDAVQFAEDYAQDLPHPNTMVCRALDVDGVTCFEETWCSIGGGFVRRDGDADEAVVERVPVAPFHDGDSLLSQGRLTGGIGDVVLANEHDWEGDRARLEEKLDRIYSAFRRCIDRGLRQTGILPGGLGIERRAKELYERLASGRVDPSYVAIARGQAYAYAVNEENAAGGLVVTAPTNGAAGIFPAVLVEAVDRLQLGKPQIYRALATGAAIASVIKTHASLSGAEVGCQGEVGSATAMAAAALCEIMGGTADQVEYAAEIGLEHNLGLTCDPSRGLVQAPCIERNAMGVAKAWSAAQLAIHSDGRHLVSLDKVITVMERTGRDMSHEYKETSAGGLAVALPEC